MKTLIMITLTIAVLFLVFRDNNNREWFAKYFKGDKIYLFLLICLLFIPALFDFKIKEKFDELMRDLNN